MRIAPPQAHRRRAADDAPAVVGSSPVRRGFALVAVIGGALSAAGPAVSAAYPSAEPPEPDPSVSLAAHEEQTDSDEKSTATADVDPILDTAAVMKSVRKANEEGRRLAADTKARNDAAPLAATIPVQPDEERGSASLPGQLIDTSDWYLTLPTGTQGSPDTIEGSQLATFHNKFFALNDQRNGIVFSAGADGVTTKNSHYPRSELREMNGTEKASWSNTSGAHVIEVREAFTKLPAAKPEVVGVQIHDAEDDVMQIRLEGKTLSVQWNDGKSETVLDPNYQLGTPFDTKVIAADGKVDVLYNGQKKATLPLSGSGWYWKVGAYVQSNGSKGDGAASTGEVVVYKADVTHSGAA